MNQITPKQNYNFSEADFADEYNSKELDLGFFNGYPFFVTIQEIPHGKYTQLQQSLIGKVRIPDSKTAAKNVLADKEVDPVAYSDNTNLAAIGSWTLKTKAGLDIPVCEQAWNFLPHRITELIEKGIKELNPTLESDFPEGLETEEN